MTKNKFKINFFTCSHLSLNLTLVALLFLLVFPFPCFSQSLLKVGALIPLSGRWGDSGKEYAKGMLDAVKWLNQRGGISGMKLEVLLIDDTSEPAEIIAAFRKLNESDQILLLTIYSTGTTLALLPHTHFNRIPTLSSSFLSHLANPIKYPFIFSIIPTGIDLTKITLKFISERSGIKTKKPKITFVGSPDHPLWYFIEEAKEYARQMDLDIGPDIWVSEFSSTPNPTMKAKSTLLSRINASRPDFVILNQSPKEAFFLLQEARNIDLQTKWICHSKTFDETLIIFDGVLGVQPVSPFGEDVSGMGSIKEAHQRWHPYDFHTLSYVEGWATIQVIIEAFRRSSPEQGISREKIKLSLESFRNFIVGGLIPPITFTSKDHRPSVESRILIIKNGKISPYTEYLSVGR